MQKRELVDDFGKITMAEKGQFLPRLSLIPPANPAFP